MDADQTALFAPSDVDGRGKEERSNFSLALTAQKDVPGGAPGCLIHRANPGRGFFAYIFSASPAPVIACTSAAAFSWSVSPSTSSSMLSIR